MSFDYVPLADGLEPHGPVQGLAAPLRAIGGLAGLALTAASGWLLHQRQHAVWFLSQRLHTDSTKKIESIGPPKGVPSNAFVPKQGVEKALFKPGPPGILQMVLSRQAVDCLFLYGKLVDEPACTDRASTSEEAWLYGAVLKRGPSSRVRLALHTGLPTDIVKGLLVCWSTPDLLHQALDHSDELTKFNTSINDREGTQRSLATVVRKDGSTAEAYFYYQLGALPSPSPAVIPKVTGVTRSLDGLPIGRVATAPPNCPPIIRRSENQPRQRVTGEDPKSLPIYELEDQLIRATIRKDFVRVVIEAPTGSGKSTQVPQILLDSGVVDDGDEIVIIQPRRLAARSLAARVAEERGCDVGGEVGYSIRFDDQSGPYTRIRYVTEGVLLRRFLTDPSLGGVGAVIFDEFHERHFYGDVTLARCLESQDTVRPDLKLIVMSATLQVEALNEYLGEHAHHLISAGRTFPVRIKYYDASHIRHVWYKVIQALQDEMAVNLDMMDGHILVFLPGVYEIKRTLEALKREPWAQCFKLHALYGALPPSVLDAAISNTPHPKIICATNIAETSVTIDGVRLVVDAGLERRSDFDASRGMPTLTVEQISQSSADQRCGRAGRTGPGVCLRLWTKAEQEQRDAEQEQRDVSTAAEIHRMDLTEAVLLLKASGIHDLNTFRWFEAPDWVSVYNAVEYLKTLGALDFLRESLTPLGEKLSKLPLAPRFGRVLLAAVEFGCNPHFFAIAAATAQGRSLFPKQKLASHHKSLPDYAEPGDISDFQALYRAWSHARDRNYDCADLGINPATAREIGQMAQQFMRIIGADQSYNYYEQDIPSGEIVGRILLTGFSDRLAIKQISSSRDKNRKYFCDMLGQKVGELDKSSIVAQKPTVDPNDPSGGRGGSKIDSRLFLAGEMVEVEGRDSQVSIKLSLATRVKKAWLQELFPQDMVERDAMVVGVQVDGQKPKKEIWFRDLLLTTTGGGRGSNAGTSNAVSDGRQKEKTRKKNKERTFHPPKLEETPATFDFGDLMEWQPEDMFETGKPKGKRFRNRRKKRGNV
eukprot:g36510.t1